MKRSPNWYTDESGQMFYPRPYARWERRKRQREFRTRLLFAVMALCIGMMFALSI